MSIDGQGHFFTIYFPGLACFVLYLDKISGERLQDHWSSGCIFLWPLCSDIIFFIDHYCAGVSNKHCLLPFFIYINLKSELFIKIGKRS